MYSSSVSAPIWCISNSSFNCCVVEVPTGSDAGWSRAGDVGVDLVRVVLTDRRGSRSGGGSSRSNFMGQRCFAPRVQHVSLRRWRVSQTLLAVFARQTIGFVLRILQGPGTLGFRGRRSLVPLHVRLVSVDRSVVLHLRLHRFGLRLHVLHLGFGCVGSAPLRAVVTILALDPRAGLGHLVDLRTLWRLRQLRLLDAPGFNVIRARNNPDGACPPSPASSSRRPRPHLSPFWRRSHPSSPSRDRR